MVRFSIRNPYFVVVVCLVLAVVGVSSLLRLPVDIFPGINIPVVVVATFYNGMPAEQIEMSITNRFERFFTLASGIDHMESRSLTGVSIIKIYFQTGINPDVAVSNIASLAMANLRRLPAGTYPPVVLKMDASSLPVCLVTVKGQGFSESALRDFGAVTVRSQLASVPGASIVTAFGGRFRQIQVYVDPLKLEAHQLSPMDVVRSVNESNVILPAGDVRIGPLDYSLYTNSQLRDVHDIEMLPIKTANGASVMVRDIGKAVDAEQLQYNVVRVDGQPSVYLPILRQGGDSSTLAIVDGIQKTLKHLVDVPKAVITDVVFNQANFVRQSIETLLHEGGLGLILTSIVILVFLGNLRATLAVFLSIPLSALATFIALWLGGGSVNTMALGGLALAFSRLIDNSVVVLENIYRHIEHGAQPREAAERGGSEVMLPVLAATLTTAVVFFPVSFLSGVSKFLFLSLAAAVVLSLFASYFVAMTVVPLYCARFLKAHDSGKRNVFGRAQDVFNRGFERMLNGYSRLVGVALRAPVLTVVAILGVCAFSVFLTPLLGIAFFPRTDAGQFVINLKAPTGTRLEVTGEEVRRVEELIRRIVPKDELRMIVSNVGATPDFSAIYTTNSGQHSAVVQAALSEDHKTSSFEYMRRVRTAMASEMPELSTYFQSGGIVDAVLNMGLPSPIDVQVAGSNLGNDYKVATQIARQIREIPGVRDVYIPQDIDAPGLQLDIDRERASQMGLQEREVVSNVITALTSSQMIAPSYWIDPKSGIDYLLTVQYPEQQIREVSDLKAIPLHAAGQLRPARLDAVSQIRRTSAATEVDHYQLRRTIDVYVGLFGEDLGRVADQIDAIIGRTKLPDGVNVTLRGMVEGMRTSFRSFGIGLLLAVLLLYLILVAQFRSFVDPLIILLAVPPGIAGVLAALVLSGTTLNVQSLMGVIMMTGIVVSNSILIVEFARRLQEEGMAPGEAVAHSCRVRLRPVLMTSLATLIGLLPMALKLGTGSEAYAPLATAILGGLSVSLVATVFLVPAAYVLRYGRGQEATAS